MQKIPNSNTPERQPATLEGRLTLRIPEVAQALGVSESSVRRMIRRRALRPLRILRVLLVPVDQLQTLLGSK
jgi:excisionase family DNA binding protein